MSPAPITTAFGEPSLQALSTMVNATQSGSLANLFAGFGEQAAQQAAGILMMALLNGDNPNDIAGMLANALNTPLYRAQTIARTEMLGAYRSANLANFQANSDVVGNWIWSADLGPRTCAACIAMNGTVHSLDESMDSHPNCRCTPIPQTKGWSDILSNAGINTSSLDLPDTSSPDIPNGSGWFAQQSPDMQQQILGKAAYQLYASGDYSLQDFVGVKNGSIYVKSVKELTGGGA